MNHLLNPANPISPLSPANPAYPLNPNSLNNSGGGDAPVWVAYVVVGLTVALLTYVIVDLIRH